MFFQDFFLTLFESENSNKHDCGFNFFFYSCVCLFFRDFVVKPSDYRHMRRSFYPLFICNLIVNTQ